MAQDSLSQAGSAWPRSADDPPPPPLAAPPKPAAAAKDAWHAESGHREEGDRLHRLLWIFAILTLVLVAPSVIGRIEYARIAAHERARLDVARENLKDFKLDQISAAYRMLAHSVGPSVVNVRTRRGMTEGQG